MNMSDNLLNRRRFMTLVGGGTVALSFVRVTPLAAQEDGYVDIPERFHGLLDETFGGWQLTPGRISIDLPVIAETGLSVPITFTVDSPMTEADHVQRIMSFVPGNPEPILTDYIVGPRLGLAEISTRVRIARTQTVIAGALMSDGSRWGATFDITVTRGACIDEIFTPDLEAIQQRELERLQFQATNPPAGN